MPKYKKLEGKLKDVFEGDLISLTSENIDLTGYVIEINKKSVKLSIEYPRNSGLERRQADKLPKPGKWYNLNEFELYRVFEKHKDIAQFL